eukprot:CAMPEP_0173391988 /NCGR_PEP_ID=MMETSP1356-20130122/18699_1 /TAXON_ID=77927 ORGANISM="Hemiselmis virescens, Strain PCC157" /NCGR_SAMPLE_ID=MMETSP1356 /ASSEMBLY_ACC=CAM_ASM_000847 /LENGTH=237 /DNA_ID=CAMNT_0014349697 /DNA_START=6 /DNA_END=719 /DNA_ORIENTATION=+
MVYYFTSKPPNEEATPQLMDAPGGFAADIPPEGCMLYMGKDKFENEELIKHSWPEDVWFHVDKESSAHVYIRLPRGSHKKGDNWFKEIHPLVVEDCCQLVKANSIRGNKQDHVRIVFTPASNLKKTQGMEVGQVGFHSDKTVFKAQIKERRNEIVNRLEKTKKWEEPNLQADLIQRNKEERVIAAKEAEVERIAKEKQQAEWKADKEAKSYDKLYDPTQMTAVGEIELDSDGEPDFM